MRHAPRRTVLLLLSSAMLCACAAPDAGPTAGTWQAQLDSPGGVLPFGLELVERQGGLGAFLINGPERIEVERVELRGNRLVLGIDPFDASITATVAPGGQRMTGQWRRTSAGANNASRLPFRAVAGTHRQSFPRETPLEEADDPRRFSGRWTVDFEKSDEPAVGIFDVDASGAAEGTFLTTIGDYRYLSGTVDGNRLRLSAFDGAHAFLFDARMQADGSLRGDFWSRDTWHEGWTARRDPRASLSDAFERTRWVAAQPDLGALSFPDLDGTLRSLDDPAFGGRARLLVVFGTWCPNCNDATRDLVDLHGRYRDRGLSILGLAFEMTGDVARDTEQVRRYAEYHRIEYPLLLAGVSDKDAASAAFPLVDRVRAFPTTIFLTADGSARAVHSGYSGPATGERHRRLRERFEELILEILAESAAHGGPALEN